MRSLIIRDKVTDCITVGVLLTISVLHDIRRAGLHLGLTLRSVARILHSDRRIHAITIEAHGRLACC